MILDAKERARHGEAVGFDRTSTPCCFSTAAQWARDKVDRVENGWSEDRTLRSEGTSNAQQTGPRVATVGGWLVFRPFSDSTKASTSGFRRQA